MRQRQYNHIQITLGHVCDATVAQFHYQLFAPPPVAVQSHFTDASSPSPDREPSVTPIDAQLTCSPSLVESRFSANSLPFEPGRFDFSPEREIQQSPVRFSNQIVPAEDHRAPARRVRNLSPRDIVRADSEKVSMSTELDRGNASQ
jgi:hypothetical protein